MSRDKIPPSCYPNPSKRARPMYAEQGTQGAQCPQGSQGPQSPQRHIGPSLSKEYVRNIRSLRRPVTCYPCGGNCPAPSTYRGGRPLNVSTEAARDKCIAADQNRLPQETVCDKYRSSSAQGRPFDPCTFRSYPATSSPTTLKGRPLNIDMEVERGKRIAMNQRVRPLSPYKTQTQDYNQASRLMSDSRFATVSNARTNIQQPYDSTGSRIPPGGSNFQPPLSMANTADYMQQPYDSTGSRRERRINRMPLGSSSFQPPLAMVQPSEIRSPHWPPSRSLHTSPVRQRADATFNSSFAATRGTIGGETITRTTVTTTTTKTTPPQNPYYYLDESMRHQEQSTPNITRQAQAFNPNESGPTQSNLKVPTQSMFASSQSSRVSTYPAMVSQNTLQSPTECVVESEKLPAAASTRSDMTDDHKFNSRSVSTPSRQDSVPSGDPPPSTQRQPEPATTEQVPPECSTTSTPNITVQSSSPPPIHGANEKNEQVPEKCFPESKQPTKNYLNPNAPPIIGQRINIGYDTFSSGVQAPMGFGHSTLNEGDRTPISPPATSTANRETFPSGSARTPGLWEQNPMPHQTHAQSPWDNDAFDIRNRFSKTLNNRSPDYSSRPFGTVPRKTDGMSQSERECAEAKRCGRIPFDSSDKHEAQKSSQLSAARRAQIENLVLDSYCPGIIQETVDGIENFNETAFSLSFHPDEDSMCNNADVAEPMTLLEAFALRVDNDRKALDDKIPENATEPEIAHIFETHYSTMNPSDINRSIRGFLLSERKMQLEQMKNAKSSPFNADVERKTMDLELFGCPFRLVTYIGQTKVASE